MVGFLSISVGVESIVKILILGELSDIIPFPEKWKLNLADLF
jgi:hypothetical protein